MDNLIGVSKIAFTISGKDIYWYGLIMCLAIIAAVVVAMILCKKKGVNTELPLNIALIVIPTGILGARLFACLFDSSLSLNEFLNFRTGGMSIIGAIVCGGIALLLYVLIKKDKRPLIYFDILCSVLILSQAIGRWGNYFNGELYGSFIDSTSVFARFPFAVLIDGKFYQALFFYEFVANLIGFFMLSSVFVKGKKDGYVTALYLIYYGIVRSILEPMRQQEFILKAGEIAISGVMSFAMIIIGVLMYLTLAIHYRKGNKNG